MTVLTGGNGDYDSRDPEGTPLLATQKVKRQRTPLPRLQITVLLLLQLAEPITSQCIYPFINQLISELDITGGDERKVGYYAGLIESLFFVTQAMTVMEWSRLSDRIGRKPVILIGLFGLCLSMICFGLSRTFLALVISRCICGALNGNLGVMKSMLGELTDSTNMAQGFAMIPIIWCIGATSGPLMGGTLARPHDRFPSVFSDPFWKKYPYFLPCAVAALFTAVVFFIIVIFLKETVVVKPKAKKHDVSNLESTVYSEEEVLTRNANPHGSQPTGPIPLRSLMTYSVMIPVANYATLALIEIGMLALQPLFYSTPTSLGGLGFSPSAIGLWMGLFGLADGIFQILFFAMIVDRFGPKHVFMFSMACFLPIFSIFPVIRWVVRVWGLCPLVWVLLSCQLVCQVMLDMAFACIMIFITAAAPSKRSLGAINGMGQTCASIARAIGPAAATSLFAFSVQYNLLGGNAVFLLLFIASCASLWLADCLPEALEDRD